LILGFRRSKLISFFKSSAGTMGVHGIAEWVGFMMGIHGIAEWPGTMVVHGIAEGRFVGIFF